MMNLIIKYNDNNIYVIIVYKINEKKVKIKIWM